MTSGRPAFFINTLEMFGFSRRHKLMINSFEFYHGIVLSRLVHSIDFSVSIQRFQSDGNASYVVNGNIGLYVKYSSKRMSPWRFTFKKEHQDEIDLLKSKMEKVFLVLVCSDDGVVCLTYEDLKQILDTQHEPIEWISATRHKREMYAVKGSNGELDFKAGQRDFPAKLFAK